MHSIEANLQNEHCTVLDDGNKRKVSQKFVITTKVGTIIITNSLPLIHTCENSCLPRFKRRREKLNSN